MISRLIGLFSVEPGAAALAEVLLRELQRRRPLGGGSGQELRLLIDELADQIERGDLRTGPLGKRHGSAAWRAAAASAYFGPGGWWDQVGLGDSLVTGQLVDERAGSYRALGWAVLEQVVRRCPPADLPARLVAHLEYLLSQPLRGERLPWQRVDRPSLEATVEWLCTLPGPVAAQGLVRLAAGALDTGPHGLTGAGGRPASSYRLYAVPLLTVLPRVLERLHAEGRLDEVLLDELPGRFAGSLALLTATADDEPAIARLGEDCQHVLRTWADDYVRALLQDVSPMTTARLRQVTAVRGVWALELLDRRRQQVQAELGGAAGKSGDTTGCLDLLRVARPGPGDDDGAVIERLRQLGEGALSGFLPLARHWRAHILQALDWPGAARLVDVIEGLTGARRRAGTGTETVRRGPRLWRVDLAAIEAAAAELGPRRLELLLESYEGNLTGSADALFLIRAALGWNPEPVADAVGRGRPLGLAAWGLAPVPNAARAVARASALALAGGQRPDVRRATAAQARGAEAGLAGLTERVAHLGLGRLEWLVETEQAANQARLGQVWPVDSGVSLNLELVHGWPSLVATRRGETLQTLPEAVRSSAIYQQARTELQGLRALADAAVASLARLMIDGAHLTLGDLTAATHHPVVGHLLESLLVIDAEGQVGWCRPASGSLQDRTGTLRPIAWPARIAHPLDLQAGDLLAVWQREAVGQGVVQPFHQLFREVYLPLPAAATVDSGRGPHAPTAADRFANLAIDMEAARPLFEAAGWTIEPNRFPYRDLPDLACRIVLQLHHGLAADHGLERTGPLQVLPLGRRGGDPEVTSDDPIPLIHVPALALSEALRTVDLITQRAWPRSPCSRRADSPETVRRRTDLVRAVAAAKGLAHVRVTGQTIVIVGTAATHEVDAATGCVRLAGGQELAGVTDNCRQSPTVTTVVHEDRRTEEVLASVLALADG